MLFTSTEQFVTLAILLVGGWLLGFASAPSPRKWKRRVQEQSDSFSGYHAEAEHKLNAANKRAADWKAEADALRADHAEAEQTIAALRAAAAAAPVAAVAAPAPVDPEPIVVDEPEPVEAAHPVIAEEPEPDHAIEAHESIHELPVEHAVEVAAAPAGEIETVAPMTPAPNDSPPAAIGPAEPEMPSKGWFASSARDELTRIRGIDGVLNTRLFSLGVVRFEDIEKLSAEDEMALEQRLALPVGYIAREQWRTQAALLRAGQDEEHATHFAAVEEPAAKV